VGGIARAEFLLRLKSAVLGVPIEVIHDADVVSLGGFMLGARSLGRLPGGNQGTERLASGLSTSLIEPDAALGERLQERFLTYTVQRSAFDDQHFNRRG
jgi:sugar (pentulose or hexulose) kinase